MNRYVLAWCAVSWSALFWLPGALAAQDASPTWRLALGLIQRGMHEEAARALRDFLRENPNDSRVPEARYRLGVAEAEQGKHQSAVEHFRVALRTDGLPMVEECRYRLGTALMAAKDPAGAAAVFEDYLGAAPRDHYLRDTVEYAAGEAWRDAGDDSRALPHFQRCAQLRDDSPRGLAFAGGYQAAFVHLRAQRAADAQRCFESLLTRWPRHEARAELAYLVGESAQRAGDLERAESAWREVVGLGGEFADDAQSGLATLAQSRGDTRATIAELRRILERGDDPKLQRTSRLALAQTLALADEAAAAGKELAILLATADLEPALRSAALELHGELALRAGDSEQAIADFAAALEFADAAGRARVSNLRAEALLVGGRAAEAAGEFAKVARTATSPLREDALHGEVRALHAAGNHTRAVERARKFLSEHRDHELAPHMQAAIAESCYAAKQFAEARTEFDALLAHEAFAATAKVKAAWSAFLHHDLPDARARFTKLSDDSALGGDARAEALSMVARIAHQQGDGDEVIAAADRYAKRHPKGEHLTVTERLAARVLRDRGSLREASARLSKLAARADEATASELAFERAEVSFRAEDYRGAQDAFAQAASRDDAIGARALEGLAWCAFELGDDAACIAAIGRALAHPAAAAIAPAMRDLEVSVHQRTGSFADAARAARTFLEQFPEHARAPEVELALGTALARQGEDRAARQVLERVLERRRSSRIDLAAYELGFVCRRLSDAPAAQRAFRRVVKDSADRELADECRILLAEGLRADGKGAAAADMLRAVEHESQQARAQYLLGEILLAAGDAAAASAAFAKAAASPKGATLRADATFAAAESAHLAGDHAAVIAQLSRFSREFPDHPKVGRSQLYLGEAYLASADAKGAIGALERYLAADVADDGTVGRARAHLGLGKARRARGEGARARAEFEKVVNLSEGALGAEATFCLGEIARDGGDQRAAADAFTKVAILFAEPNLVSSALLEASKCWHALGQADKARKLLDELLEKHPRTEAAIAGKSLRAQLETEGNGVRRQ